MLSHHGSRICVRCQRDLMDAASLNEGIGPICRKLDNALLAKSLPSDAAKAFEAIDSVNIEALDPETLPTFLEIRKALADSGHGPDWRKPVKQMEWALSFPLTRKVAFHACVTAARALGYTGLAALWEGEASTGAAKVRYQAGRIYVAGPRNKAFRMKVRSLHSYAFHTATGEWSVPTKHADAFERLVQTYYPNHTGLSETLEQAHASEASQPAAPSAPKVSAKVRLIQNGGWIEVHTPYRADFVAALKSTIPYLERRWNGIERCWHILGTHRDAILGLVVRYYSEVPAMDLADAKAEGGIPVATHQPATSPGTTTGTTLTPSDAPLPF